MCVCDILFRGLWQVEALKTRAAAKSMVDYMRRVNPQLARALLDDRDEVGAGLPIYPITYARVCCSLACPRSDLPNITRIPDYLHTWWCN